MNYIVNFYLRSFIILACSIFLAENLSAQVKPNVIIIYADDLGYGDLSCYGATKLQTPNIDRLAAEGRMFTDAHSVSAVCTPSRYALLTGEYPFRGNGGNGIWGPLRRDHKLIVDTDELTLAKVMKNQGYMTAAIGKWHLGFGNESPTDWNKPLQPGPQQLGFDYYFGVPFVNSGPPYVYVENDRVVGWDPADPLIPDGSPASPTQEYPDKNPNSYAGGLRAHELYKDDEIGITLAEKSVEWIKKNKAQPFFMYLSTTNIHHPFSPNKRFQGTSNSGRYGDFVHELDWMVGQVMEALEQENISDNTLIIFTSDNGGMLNVGGQEAWRAGHRMNGELLGFKFDAWEGGHRVPFIARWPGKIEAGSQSGQLISNVDMVATMAALTGYELKDMEAPDSYNVLPALTGTPDAMIRDYLVIAPFRAKNLALRMGDWMYIGARGGGGWSGGQTGKHIMGGAPATAFTKQKNSDIKDGKIRADAPGAQLYNLDTDMSQQYNVIEDNPHVAEIMQSTLNIIKKSGKTR